MQAQVPQNLRVPCTQPIVQGQWKAGCGVALFWLWAAAIGTGHQGIPHSCLSWDWERAFRLLRARSMESRKTEGKDTSHTLSLVGSKSFFLDREDPSPHKESCIYGLRDLRLYLRKYSDWNPGCLFLHPRDDYAHLPSRLWSLIPKATSGRIWDWNRFQTRAFLRQGSHVELDSPLHWLKCCFLLPFIISLLDLTYVVRVTASTTRIFEDSTYVWIYFISN